ncbi:hypothetical protein [Kaarinaea lacus]
MLLEDYLTGYANSEQSFREKYGELAFYSRIQIYGEGDEIKPVASWANYIGSPLILPRSDFVPYIAITYLNPENEPITYIRLLTELITALAENYDVKPVQEPEHQIVAYLPNNEETIENLHNLASGLSEIE